MPATIRLMRVGKKGKPSYRIVVIDRRKKRSGRYIDIIGFYNPFADARKVTLDKEKIDAWIKKGAIISEGMKKLLKMDLLL